MNEEEKERYTSSIEISSLTNSDTSSASFPKSPLQFEFPNAFAAVDAEIQKIESRISYLKELVQEMQNNKYRATDISSFSYLARKHLGNCNTSLSEISRFSMNLLQKGGNMKLITDSIRNTFLDFIVDMSNFEMTSETVGRGSFSTVFLIKEKKPGNIYALKKCNVDTQFFTDDLFAFFREVEILTKMHHETILPVLGFSTDDFSIVTPYIRNGSLENILNQKVKLTNMQILKIILGIAVALRYLHSHSVIHRDLKPENVLINENFEPIVSDFGLSKLFSGAVSDSIKRSTNVGTPLYTAPEIMNENEYSSKCDVYSFALVLYRITQREVPFLKNGIRNRDSLKAFINSKKRPKFLVDTPYKDLIIQCWDQESSKRPTFAEIVDSILEKGYPGSESNEFVDYSTKILQHQMTGREIQTRLFNFTQEPLFTTHTDKVEYSNSDIQNLILSQNSDQNQTPMKSQFINSKSLYGFSESQCNKIYVCDERKTFNKTEIFEDNTFVYETDEEISQNDDNNEKFDENPENLNIDSSDKHNYLISQKKRLVTRPKIDLDISLSVYIESVNSNCQVALNISHTHFFSHDSRMNFTHLYLSSCHFYEFFHKFRQMPGKSPVKLEISESFEPQFKFNNCPLPLSLALIRSEPIEESFMRLDFDNFEEVNTCPISARIAPFEYSKIHSPRPTHSSRDSSPFFKTTNFLNNQKNNLPVAGFNLRKATSSVFINRFQKTNEKKALVSQNDQKSKEMNEMKEKADNGDIEAMFKYSMKLNELHLYSQSTSYLKKAADNGNVKAQFQYGEILRKGNPGVKVNLNEAKSYYKIAADNGSPEAMFEYGQLSKKDNNNDYQKYCMMALNKQNRSAQRWLALEAQKNQNWSKAAYYFHLSADQGDPISQFSYAQALKNGFGIEKNLDLAREYLKKSADKNYPAAQFEYGMLIRKQNQELSDKYINASFSKNNDSAINFIAHQKLLAGKESEAIELFRKSAKNGNTNSILHYAKLMSLKNEINDEIIELLKKAANKEDIECQLFLAKLLSKANERDAKIWYEKAALNGDAEGQFRYGEILMKDKKSDEALKFLKEAAAQKHIDAIFLYCKLASYVKVQLSEIELTTFYDILLQKATYVNRVKKAANNGIRDMLYFYGRYSKSDEMIGKAAKLGNMIAQFEYATYLELNQKGQQQESEFYFKQSKENGYTAALIRHGNNLKKTGEIYQAVKSFKRAANKGSIEALYELVRMNVDKRPFPDDAKNAYINLRNKANSGSQEAKQFISTLMSKAKVKEILGKIE
ncbi:hypothetical protein TRFO_08587 [Tritrichomonas foetus]|uniref:Protein kinase domain-containing protein n=1 Tax=Tritrichomonas foetus TaxID=1144522 RepID=A0A1J4JIS3_9EUKA|nr:hypothetical protein TRFO_08587 [Tritrichomonas foetus]|eukprot:OHS99034.1 hypothetical protein TRFO_08587 [Tritrichomonas foetus]